METKPFVQALLEAGAHYGFTKTRRHPSTTSFIIATKNKADLINLDATNTQVEKAKEVLKGLAAGGKTIMVVGTKPEAEGAVRDIADRMHSLYVNNRWVGGMITNFPEIRKRIQKYTTLKEEKTLGTLEKYTKKERLLIDREMAKMERNFGGIVEMKRVPDMMIVVDSGKENIAVTEANKMQIPVIAICNTDCDLTKVDYPIVMNDSARASISLVLNELADGYMSGKV